MAQVTVTIHNRAYQVACEDGQELHVQKLAAYIDRRVTELAAKSGVPGPSGQVTESRLLVMAALLIADELGETYDEIEAMRQAPPKVVPDPATLKAAEEARAAASAAKAQLGEAEAATRTAQARLAAAESRATQAEAALAAAVARAEDAEAQLRTHGVEEDAVRATIATLTARADEATADSDHVADGLNAVAGRIEAMAERLERAVFR
ncbi:MAG TPA: cell division protein ZapA [Alphaproteobacteria bacterium]|nr:cell division protein ZapA [Alphaproteobacteria bacterium]